MRAINFGKLSFLGSVLFTISHFRKYMSEKNPFRNLRTRVLKRELVKIHGQRTITAKLLQDKKERNGASTTTIQATNLVLGETKMIGKTKVTKVAETKTKMVGNKQQQTRDTRSKRSLNIHEHKPQIKITKLEPEEEELQEGGQSSKNKHKFHIDNWKRKHSPDPASPKSPARKKTKHRRKRSLSAPEILSPERQNVNSGSDLFDQQPNLTPPAPRLRRTRGFCGLQKPIKFSEE